MWQAKTRTYRTTKIHESGLRALKQRTGPDGRDRSERNDCVVESIAFATGIPYYKVYDALSSTQMNGWMAHRRNRGWNLVQAERAMERLGLVWQREDRREYKGRAIRFDSYYSSFDGKTQYNVGPTLARFLREEGAEGRWIVDTNDHWIGVIDGVPHHVAHWRQGVKRRKRLQGVYFLCLDG